MDIDCESSHCIVVCIRVRAPHRPYLYIGGLMGVIVIAAGAFIPGRIPFSTYFICVVAGELGCSFLYDSVGFMRAGSVPPTPVRVAGVCLVALAPLAFQRAARSNKVVPMDTPTRDEEAGKCAVKGVDAVLPTPTSCSSGSPFATPSDSQHDDDGHRDDDVVMLPRRGDSARFVVHAGDFVPRSGSLHGASPSVVLAAIEPEGIARLRSRRGAAAATAVGAAAGHSTVEVVVSDLGMGS